MARSPLRLLDWSVPIARHRYTRRDTALYALSLGVARDAADRRQLALVDPWSPQLKGLPSMALVLGYPGFWLGEPAVEEATGIAPWQVLHGEQAVELGGPLPVDAAVVGETRVTALVDKGVGRGCLLHSERHVYDEHTGALIAVCRQVHVLRAAGGCGSAGEARATKIVLPQEPAPVAIDTPTMAQQALLYRLNGDPNPLHIDPDVAGQAGYSRPILHGMCTAGMAVAAVVGARFDFDPERIVRFSVRMTNPVLPGETLRTEVWPDGSFRTRVLERDAMVLSNGRIDWRSSETALPLEGLHPAHPQSGN